MLKVNNYQDGEVLNINQIKLNGDGKTIYFKNLKMNLWTYILNSKSINEATDTMKINLELKDPEIVKDFEFSPS